MVFFKFSADEVLAIVADGMGGHASGEVASRMAVEIIQEVIDEAKLAAKLNHRNIVQIYDFGNQQESYYIAMEYIFGKDLRSILKKSKERQGRLPLAQCAYIITEGENFIHVS